MENTKKKYLKERIEFYKAEREKTKMFIGLLTDSEGFPRAETSLSEMKVLIYSQFIDELELLYRNMED